MTIFDYLKKNCGVAIYTDEYGNTYMETDEWEYEKIISGAIEISDKADDDIVWICSLQLQCGTKDLGVTKWYRRRNSVKK